MKKINCKTLRIQPIYTVLVGLFLLICSILLLLLPTILNWEKASLGYEILFFAVALITAIYGVLTSLKGTQYAIITDEEIIIKGFFIKTVIIKWHDVKSITKEKILTYNSRAQIFLEYIVVKTDENTKVKTPRKQTEKCCQILATKKNLVFIRKQARKHKYSGPFF